MAQVTVELQRLLPGWKWVLQESGDKTFETTFPSAVELHWMVEWGPVEARSTKGKLKIGERENMEEYKYEILKVWVQFRRLSKELREFPIIWAIGSILGVTRMVDMKFTKKYGQSR